MTNAIFTVDWRGGYMGRALLLHGLTGFSHFGIKLIHHRWQPTTKGGERRDAFFLPPSTLLGGLSVTELFILYFIPFFPRHTLIYPVSFVNPFTRTYAERHQSNILCYQIGIYIVFRTTMPYSGQRDPSLLWLQSREAPSYKNALKAVTHAGN